MHEVNKRHLFAARVFIASTDLESSASFLSSEHGFFAMNDNELLLSLHFFVGLPSFFFNQPAVFFVYRTWTGPI